MVELLRYLEANGFVTYIASGGDRDFMRPVASDPYRGPLSLLLVGLRVIRLFSQAQLAAPHGAGEGLEAGQHVRRALCIRDLVPTRFHSRTKCSVRLLRIIAESQCSVVKN